MVVWFTGIPSAGKTTLSKRVHAELRAAGHPVELLDGDLLRRKLSKDLGFTKADRDENIRRIGAVAGQLAETGVLVLVAAIAPYRSVRDEIRQNLGEFAEVYVNAPLAICEARDVKGLYHRARLGEVKGFTGVDDPYEAPLHPEVECRTDLETIDESARKVIEYVRGRWLNALG
jgi:adenylylsulfate kinase